MEGMFFSGWTTLGRTLMIGIMAYVVLIVFLRVSGKRTLSKMNAFDFIVTVALGSALANIMLSRDVALAEGALAFALLIGLQFVVTWASVRLAWLNRIVTGEPRMLLHQGECLPIAMRQARITMDELRAAVRQQGIGSLEAVEAVVLETDGSLSVVRSGGQADSSALEGVRHGSGN